MSAPLPNSVIALLRLARDRAQVTADNATREQLREVPGAADAETHRSRAQRHIEILTAAIHAIEGDEEAGGVAPGSDPIDVESAFDLRPDPLETRTASELIACLRAFRAWNGQTTLRAIAAHCGIGMSHVTIRNTLNSDRLPPLRNVVAVAAGCGGTDEDQRNFRTAWRRIAVEMSKPSYVRPRPPGASVLGIVTPYRGGQAGPIGQDMHRADREAAAEPLGASSPRDQLDPNDAVSATPAVSFAEMLRQIRIQHLLTQEELAQASGLHTNSISALERGINHSPQKQTAQMLADGLQLEGSLRAEFLASARRPRAAA